MDWNDCMVNYDMKLPGDRVMGFTKNAMCWKEYN